jgi:anthranilate synthase/aminodeoxychorismate synthase-like glutamine amidotransferase
VGPRVFLLDNYDSFTWNLAQGMRELGAEVTVRRHDETVLPDVLDGRFDAVVVSPGPGRPRDAGVTPALVKAAAGRLPLLGVCLGHQAIAEVFGARLVRAPRVMHGKTSSVQHDRQGVFSGLASPLTVGRYHSLAVDPASLPAELVASATARDGAQETLMGLRHRDHPRVALEGVQFHPESILTPEGGRMLGNFLSLVGGAAPR